MASFVRACHVDDVVPGGAVVVEAGGKTIAIFDVDGTLHAIDNECPHRGGPLGEGELNGCLVTCPWHAWDFDVTTGESVGDDLVVARYQVATDGDDVLVAV